MGCWGSVVLFAPLGLRNDCEFDVELKKKLGEMTLALADEAGLSGAWTWEHSDQCDYIHILTLKWFTEDVWELFKQLIAKLDWYDKSMVFAVWTFEPINGHKPQIWRGCD